MSLEIRIMIDKIKNFKFSVNENFLTHEDLLIEASKLSILKDKEGLSLEQAEILDNLCGPLSLWMFSKIKETVKNYLKNRENKSLERNFSNIKIDDKTVIDYINEKNIILRNREDTQSIMDWVRVGLNGNVKPYKDLSYEKLFKESEKWHDSLKESGGVINYVEKNPIILDFRDENGNGFYWVDLQTLSSKEECKRMGHCGTSSRGNIYSLREVLTIRDDFKINKSRLTAAIGKNNGIIYQLKGPKNSKPKDELHKYILPLFFEEVSDGYFIKGFGSEYASQNDFKISDLPVSVILEIYQKRPDLFNFSKGINELRPYEITVLTLPEMKEIRESMRESIISSIPELKGTNINIKFPNSDIAKVVKLYPDYKLFESIPAEVINLTIEGDGSFAIDVPNNIGDFKNLELLALKNIIKSLPETIANCKKLKFLYLSNNPSLTKLPEAILNMSFFLIALEDLPNLDKRSQEIKNMVSE